MLTRTTLSAFLIAGFLICLPSPGSATDANGVRVIVNSSNPTTTISKANVSRLFLKKAKKWEHGTAVHAVDQKASSSIREAFSRFVHGKSASANKAYWQKQIFTGRGVPPPEKATDSQVVAYVKRHAGAIGYVSSRADIGGVKVVKVAD